MYSKKSNNFIKTKTTPLSILRPIIKIIKLERKKKYM